MVIAALVFLSAGALLYAADFKSLLPTAPQTEDLAQVK